MPLIGVAHLTSNIFNLGWFSVFQRKVNPVYPSLVAKLYLCVCVGIECVTVLRVCILYMQ